MKNLKQYEYEKPRSGVFTVYVQNFTDKKSFRPHWHDYYELLFFRSGTGTIYCNDAEIHVAPDDLIVINPAEVHTMESTDGADYYCVILYPGFFSDIPFDGIQFQSHIQNDQTAKLLMYSLYDEHKDKQPGSDMMLKGHAYMLMTHLLRNYTVTHLSEKETASLTLKARRMQTVLDYIDAHYPDKLSTKQLAELCHLNESYFCRYFKRATGKTIMDYINAYRSQKAAELLKTANDSIADIAAKVGFDDVTYFGRCFKQYKGTSPSQYRSKKTET